jgi:hypothetical protein
VSRRSSYCWAHSPNFQLRVSSLKRLCWLEFLRILVATIQLPTHAGLLFWAKYHYFRVRGRPTHAIQYILYIEMKTTYHVKCRTHFQSRRRYRRRPHKIRINRRWTRKFISNFQTTIKKKYSRMIWKKVQSIVVPLIPSYTVRSLFILFACLKLNTYTCQNILRKQDFI